MGDTLSNEEVIKMEFNYVTGKCANCGANNFHFDEMKQTFICDYCGAEVFSAEIVDRHTKLFNEEAVEKIEDTTVDEVEDTNEYGTPYFVYIIRGMVVILLVALKGMFLQTINEEFMMNGAFDTPINIIAAFLFISGVVNVIAGLFKMLKTHIPIVDAYTNKDKNIW